MQQIRLPKEYKNKASRKMRLSVIGPNQWDETWFRDQFWQWSYSTIHVVERTWKVDRIEAELRTINCIYSTYILLLLRNPDGLPSRLRIRSAWPSNPEAFKCLQTIRWALNWKCLKMNRCYWKGTVWPRNAILQQTTTNASYLKRIISGGHTLVAPTAAFQQMWFTAAEQLITSSSTFQLTQWTTASHDHLQQLG